MHASKLSRKFVAAALAAALTVGGLVGVGIVGTADHADHGTAEQEQAGGTWSFRLPPKGGGATTNGGTWS